MNIIILTDRIDAKLLYVLKQFLNFTSLDIEITLKRLSVGKKIERPDIIYAYNPQNLGDTALSIYRSDNWTDASSRVTAGTFEENKFFVQNRYVKDSLLINYKNSKIELNFDIFAQLFYQLSCGEEFLYEKTGGKVDSRKQNLTSATSQSTMPNVNNLFLILEKLISQLFGIRQSENLRYPDGKKFAIVLTHDVDSPQKTAKERLKHLWHGSNRTARFMRSGEYKRARNEIFQTFAKFARIQGYNNIEYLSALEEAYGVRSSFNVYSMNEKNKKGIRQWISNPEYDISQDKGLAQKLGDIAAKGFDIGLHGSHDSGNRPLLLKQELQGLQKVIQQKVSGGRQHFLTYSVMTTPKIFQNEGIEYDTSVGFRDMNGFRAGACLPYYLYYLPEDRPTNVLEIPLVLMDGVLFDRKAYSKEIAWAYVLRILEKIRDAQGCGSVVWHQRVFNNKDYPFWEDIYRMLIQWVLDNGGGLYPASAINSFWREKKSAHSLKVIED